MSSYCLRTFPIYLRKIGATPIIAPAETASDSPMFGDYQSKGFLTDYFRISKSKDEDGAYEYKDLSADYGKYNKLLVDRIKIANRGSVVILFW